ncbi:hypothetical protein [Metabacillus fastidiosus]|uniref:hypothetical protein n=1 Tax=Metabacillus fastidiosus TaxID=1458 RepID=UPI002DB6947C|nr:hypothetical protein [Metabacillus fastidiosus]MEC2077189.1 hypothetical protein [Metabacillus fastidiosus]
MKKLILPIALTAIFLYSLSGWLGVFKEKTIIYNIFFILNIVCLICLIIASIYGSFIQIRSGKQVSFEKEDDWQLSLEHAAYIGITWIQVAFSISFIAFITSFVLIRDSHPKIVLYAMLLFTLSLITLTIATYLIRYTRPEFKLPDPKSHTYQQELFDISDQGLFNMYDDGEKYIMLKNLYKLY